MNLYKYKDALGKPNEGFHALRLCGYAVNDVLGTLVIAILLSDICSCTLQSISKMFVTVFAVAILLHRMFGVNTTLNKQIFGVIN